MSTTSEWQQLFEEISIPRLAGSKNCDAVVTRLADVLGKKGYSVELQGFDAGPERLVGGSVFGLLLTIGSFTAAVMLILDLTATRLPGAATGVAVLGLVVALLAAIAALESSGRLHSRWVARLLGYRFPTGSGGPDAYTVRAANITAVKDAEPRVWLVAHSDSKVQRHSLGARIVAVRRVLAGVGFLLLVPTGALLLVSSGALNALARAGVPITPVTIVGAAVTALGAILAVAGGMVLTVAGLKDGSPGSIDNATGVVAVLATAEKLGWRSEVGILITGAEELAMAGAREWVKKARSGNVFVNFDGVDGKGQYILWVHNGAAPGTARSLASQLCQELGPVEARIRKFLTFGMFVDGMILAKKGMAGVTVQRGTLDTAAVAHTPKDIPLGVDIEEGAVRAGRAAASVIEGFLTKSP